GVPRPMTKTKPPGGVPPESLAPATLTWDAASARPTAVRRTRAGYWTLTLDVEFEAMLPDGRTLRFWGLVDVPGRQSGRGAGRPRRADDKSHENS
ncbi:hypothetical protein B7486_58165, partial [cyanobacterium TDX16]